MSIRQLRRLVLVGEEGVATAVAAIVVLSDAGESGVPLLPVHHLLQLLALRGQHSHAYCIDERGAAPLALLGR